MGTVLDYKKEGRIAFFTLNRPEVYNSLNLQMIQELREGMLDFREDNESWVAIITGAGTKPSAAEQILKNGFPLFKRLDSSPGDSRYSCSWTQSI